jgi:hypothetical protein
MRASTGLAERIAELQRRAAGAAAIASRHYFGLRGRHDEARQVAAAGVDRVLLMLPPAGADETLPRVERYAELAARHR